MNFFKLILSDILKLNRTIIKRIHILLPIIGVILFVCYYSVSSHSSIGKVNEYLQSMGIIFPLIIGVITAICIDTEYTAGNFIVMLTESKVKYHTLMSKIILLIVMGFFSVLIACIGFYLGIIFLYGDNNFQLNFYLKISVIFIGSSIFLYIFHLFLSMKYGKNVSIGIGIVEFMLSAILLTDLGQGIWPFIPCTWAIHFVDYFFKINANIAFSQSDTQQTYYGIVLCVLLTVAILFSTCIWFNQWEGRRSEN